VTRPKELRAEKEEGKKEGTVQNRKEEPACRRTKGAKAIGWKKFSDVRIKTRETGVH